jgi:hypothetical protein
MIGDQRELFLLGNRSYFGPRPTTCRTNLTAPGGNLIVDARRATLTASTWACSSIRSRAEPGVAKADFSFTAAVPSPAPTRCTALLSLARSPAGQFRFPNDD